MDKNKEVEKEEVPEVVPEVEVKAVSLAEVPSQYALVFRTPEGDMNQDQYLVWLGNMFLEFKASIAGN